MIIVSGHLTVDPPTRDHYLTECTSVVEQARAASGCLDFAISADLVDASRINVYERWESDTHLEEFRGSGPDSGQEAEIRDAVMARYRISATEAP